MFELAHLGGVPVEETLAFLAPIIGSWILVASASARLLLTRTVGWSRSRRSAALQDEQRSSEVGRRAPG